MMSLKERVFIERKKSTAQGRSWSKLHFRDFISNQRFVHYFVLPNNTMIGYQISKSYIDIRLPLYYKFLKVLMVELFIIILWWKPHFTLLNIFINNWQIKNINTQCFDHYICDHYQVLWKHRSRQTAEFRLIFEGWKYYFMMDHEIREF